MPKSIEEIKVLISTDLFKKGIAKKYVNIGDDQITIQYNCKNQAKRKLSNPEEFVQATAFLKLIIDYDYLPQNITINESVQIGSETKTADVIVYNETNNKILILVECKESSTNERQFQIAIDQAYSYAHAKAANYVWVTSGIRDEYFELSSLYPVERISLSDIPKRGGETKRFKYIKGEFDPVEVTQGELLQKFKSAHNALWGGGALSPTEAFDELDKLIFCKLWDEGWETNNLKSKGEPYDFQIIYYPEDKNDISNTKAKKELEARIHALYAHGQKKDPEVFKKNIDLDMHKIFTVVQYLQDIHLTKTDLDVKGLAFQSFMGSFFRGEFGQYFTPHAIVQFIVKAIGIKREWKILDTSCGSGGFLLEALKEVRNEADNNFPKDSSKWRQYWHEFAVNRLFGIEVNEQISRVAKMNMIIHDDGHTNIIHNDGLKNNQTIEKENRNMNFQDGTFDLIMTNPPFGTSIKSGEANYYKEYELFQKNLGITELKERVADDNNKNKWQSSVKTEILFLERCYKFLKECGYLAIVLPDGVLTNSTCQYVRDWIIEKFRIIAVVSLPQHTFAHVKAGVKSSILFLKKHPIKLTKKLENILCEVKTSVIKGKINTDEKDELEEKILEQYKEKIKPFISDYIIKMFEIENVGYDATGRKIKGSEFDKVAHIIKEFIANEGL